MGRRVERFTHKASGEAGVSSDLAINLDQSLFDNLLHLISSEGVLQPISKKHYQGNALPLLMWSSRRFRSLRTRESGIPQSALLTTDTHDRLHISQRACQASNGEGH